MRYYLSQAEYEQDKDAPKIENCLRVHDNSSVKGYISFLGHFAGSSRIIEPQLNLKGEVHWQAGDDTTIVFQAVIDLREHRTLTPEIARLLAWCGYKPVGCHEDCGSFWSMEDDKDYPILFYKNNTLCLTHV